LELYRTLSDESLKELIRNKFVPGRVFFLLCSFMSPPRPKYLVLVSNSNYPLFFIINSDINNYIMKRQWLLNCQVGLGKDDYDFLTQNSYVNCTEAKNDITLDEIIDQIRKSQKYLSYIIKERTLIESDLIKICIAVKESVPLEEDKKELIREFLKCSDLNS